MFQQHRPALSSLPTLYYNRKPLKKVHQFNDVGLTLDARVASRRPLHNRMQVPGGLPLLCGISAIGRASPA